MKNYNINILHNKKKHFEQVSLILLSKISIIHFTSNLKLKQAQLLGLRKNNSDLEIK